MQDGKFSVNQKSCGFAAVTVGARLMAEFAALQT
jgi:hypothetical protein